VNLPNLTSDLYLTQENEGSGSVSTQIMKDRLEPLIRAKIGNLDIYMPNLKISHASEWVITSILNVVKETKLKYDKSESNFIFCRFRT